MLYFLILFLVIEVGFFELGLCDIFLIEVVVCDYEIGLVKVVDDSELGCLYVICDGVELCVKVDVLFCW